MKNQKKRQKEEVKFWLAIYDEKRHKHIPVKILSNKTNQILGLGDILDRFCIAHAKLFNLEVKARQPRISNEARGILVKQIRQVNDNERIKIRNVLNNLGGKDFWDERIQE